MILFSGKLKSTNLITVMHKKQVEEDDYIFRLLYIFYI